MNGACVEGPLLGTVGHKVYKNMQFYGYTPLMFAKTTELTKLLLEHKADVNATKDGKTVLHFAKEQKADPEAIGLLEAAAKTSLRK